MQEIHESQSGENQEIWQQLDTYSNYEVSTYGRIREIEIWKPVNIKHYNELYEVSTYGRIRKIDTHKILNTSSNHDGYQIINLRACQNNQSMFVHRLVALTYVQNPDNLKNNNHIDGNRINNNASNLVWCKKIQK